MLTSGSLRPLIDVPAGGRFEAESGEITRRWPQFLPGGKTLLFMAHGNTGAAHQGHVIVQNASGRTLVQRGAVFGRYSPSGHLLYVNGGKLFAAPFDADHLQVTGRAVPIADDIATALISGTAQYAFSDTGMLAYRRARNPKRILQWWTHRGKCNRCVAYRPNTRKRDSRATALACCSPSATARSRISLVRHRFRRAHAPDLLCRQRSVRHLVA